MAWPYNTETWRKMREEKLAADPVCQICGDYQKLQVHHANPLTPEQRKNQDKKAAFPPLALLTTLCNSCHSILTTTGHSTEAQLKAQWDALTDEDFTDYDKDTEATFADEPIAGAFGRAGWR